MGTLAVPVHRYKMLGGWALEKAARLKPNGRLLRRSPLSDLIELEGLLLGVQARPTASAHYVASPTPTPDFTCAGNSALSPWRALDSHRWGLHPEECPKPSATSVICGGLRNRPHVPQKV